MPSEIRLATDEDVLRVYSRADTLFPRTNPDGSFLRSWDVQHSLATEEIERRFRASRSTPDRFELGNVGLRSRETLRSAAAYLCLHFLFVDGDTSGDPFMAEKASYFMKRADAIIESELSQIDYDADNSGTVDASEENQPMPRWFVRG